MSDNRITLRNAIELNRLDDFISQAEADGIGPADEGELRQSLARVIKQPQSEDRASRSPSRGGSSGK